MKEKPVYQVSDYEDRIEPGRMAKIEHRIYYMSPPDISGMVKYTLAELEKMHRESADKEKVIFENVRKTLQTWEKQAAGTQLLDKALQYVKTPPVKHTSNRWVKGEYNWHNISNAVYKMDYRIWENTRYDRTAQKSVTTSWELSWSVYLQDPARAQSSGRVAGQERKRFVDKAAMDKYLQGRIKAYSHLFTEVSPPVPKDHICHFIVNGQLLPGYTVEHEQEKTSVLDQLAKAKTLAQEQFRKGDDFNQPPHLSPWGEIKSCEKLYSGVFQVTAGEHNGIMVANEVISILSPLTCKQGESRGGFLCFGDKALVIRDLSSKKLLDTEQGADKAISMKKPRQEAER